MDGLDADVENQIDTLTARLNSIYASGTSLINPSRIGLGNINRTEIGYIKGLDSNMQDQIDASVSGDGNIDSFSIDDSIGRRVVIGSSLYNIEDNEYVDEDNDVLMIDLQPDSLPQSVAATPTLTDLASNGANMVFSSYDEIAGGFVAYRSVTRTANYYINVTNLGERLASHTSTSRVQEPSANSSFHETPWSNLSTGNASATSASAFSISSSLTSIGISSSSPGHSGVEVENSSGQRIRFTTGGDNYWDVYTWYRRTRNITYRYYGLNNSYVQGIIKEINPDTGDLVNSSLNSFGKAIGETNSTTLGISLQTLPSPSVGGPLVYGSGSSSTYNFTMKVPDASNIGQLSDARRDVEMQAITWDADRNKWLMAYKTKWYNWDEKRTYTHVAIEDTTDFAYSDFVTGYHSNNEPNLSSPSIVTQDSELGDEESDASVYSMQYANDQLVYFTGPHDDDESSSTDYKFKVKSITSDAYAGSVAEPDLWDPRLNEAISLNKENVPRSLTFLPSTGTFIGIDGLFRIVYIKYDTLNSRWNAVYDSVHFSGGNVDEDDFPAGITYHDEKIYMIRRNDGHLHELDLEHPTFEMDWTHPDDNTSETLVF